MAYSVPDVSRLLKPLRLERGLNFFRITVVSTVFKVTDTTEIANIPQCGLPLVPSMLRNFKLFQYNGLKEITPQVPSK